MRRKQGTLYASAGKKISEINELITEIKKRITKTVPKSAAESFNQEKDVEQIICNELVTLKHFEERIFPWEPASRSTNSELKYKLISI